MINPLRDPAETCIIEFWWLGIATTLFDKDNEEFIKSKIAINIKIRSDSRTLSKKTPGTMISVEKTRKYLVSLIMAFKLLPFIIWKKLVMIVGIITRAIVSLTSTTNESKEITTVINPTPSIPWVMPPIKYDNKI